MVERAGAAPGRIGSLFPVPCCRYPQTSVQLWLEVEGVGDRNELPGGGAALIAFMSFAVSRGFGATHPLIALADRLHDEHRVRMGALTTFYEAEAEDAEDREKLELAWQEPAPLLRALQDLVHAFETDPMLGTFARRGNAESIPAEAAALADLLVPLAEDGTRVRLVFAL